MKKSIVFLLVIATGMFCFTSCNKEDNTDLAPAEPEAANFKLPEIENDSTLFSLLPDSLRQWMNQDSRNKEEVNHLRNSSPRTLYSINMTGSTLGGQYPFRRTGCLAVRNTLTAPGNINLANGRNAYDVAMFSGQPILGQTGALWYMTNTSMCGLYSYIGCINGAAALDVAYVTYDARKRLLQIDIDGRFYNNSAAGSSILGTLNIFNTSRGSTIYQVISGRIQIQFNADFSQLSGVMRVYGSSFGWGPVEYYAQFGGYAARTCNP